jgi:conjugative relaxase-like TrwC/TraI family protein
MARMAMMGRHSVDYHRKTLGVGAPSDHLDVRLEPGVEAQASAALRYYSSHGETPLVWGGSGAERLGLSGAVSAAQYEAVYAEGGAVDPTTGVRLVRTQRPGMEIVVSAQKSLAELGVISRVDDMHAILSAETDATMGYLDWVTREAGGRRGRAREASTTQGMTWVRTRHATSRAGDPSPHDHILVANVVEMADDQGGFKAPDTTVWRDHLHAATMVGRMASAAKAIELGYAIEADPGPSGKLGHWRLAGIPKDLEEVHSKRGLEIQAELAESGFVSPRAKEIAANETRPRKRHEPIADLVSRWHDELAGAG